MHTMIDTPPKFRFFIDLIHNGIFYHPDYIVVLEKGSWAKQKLTPSDIKLNLETLKERGVIIKYRWCELPDALLVPMLHESKEIRLSRNRFLDFLETVFSRKTKEWLFILVHKDFDAFYENMIAPKQVNAAELSYDSLHNFLKQGDAEYRIEAKLKSSLFRILWENRHIVKDGKVLRKGEAMPREALAVQMELVESNRDFTLKRKEFKNIIGGLNSAFKKHKFRLNITQRGGVQLIESQ